MTFLDFLRDVGKHFSVNAMIARESVKRRLEEREQGISYTEFSYQLLQAYDFAHLYETLGLPAAGRRVRPVGQHRRRHRPDPPAARRRGVRADWPLLTTADGAKFGKSAGNAVWLDPELTSPYAYYQYWLNADDRDVVRFLKLFTFLDLDEIAELEAAHAADPRARDRSPGPRPRGDPDRPRRRGVAAAEKATAVLFGDEPFVGMEDRVLADAFAEAPTAELARARLDDRIGLLDLLREGGAAASNGEARRLVEQGAVRVNNAPATDPAATVGPDDLASETTIVLRVGKKRYFLVRFT
jgi:tyrosyl-tRNA synthetase